MVLTCLTWLAGSVYDVGAATYHADPVNGRDTNDGSEASPWRTLESVMESRFAFSPGDVLVLAGGHHGRAVIRGENATEVVIRNREGESPTLTSVLFRQAKNWRVQGLTISPKTGSAYERLTLVNIRSDSSEITVQECRLFSLLDSSGWSAKDWDTLACNGVYVDGTRCRIVQNHLLNVNFGISVTGVSNRVEGNVVENFSGDGLRGLGDYGVFENNTVKNCYDVNENHDDGFQSWSVGEGGVGTGVVRGLVLRGNRIINYEDPNQPHRGTLQGIGCFDGFFEDWIIENNEVRVDHWHGITFSGARNCRIINNTVSDLNDSRPGPPWIRIGPHKNGSPSTGNVVRDNRSTAYSLAPGSVVEPQMK